MTVQCPFCMDEVRVPAGVPDTAVVRCPLCEEEYQLADANLPPMLEVVSGGDGGAAELTLAPVGAAAASATSEADADPGAAGMPAFSLTDSPSTAADASGAATGSRPKARPAARRPKKKSNPLKEVVKVVGGGVIGLAIGQLCLWHLPGEWKKSQRDPFGLGPKVSQYAPWIVPDQVAGKVEPKTPNPNEQTGGAANDGGSQVASGAGGNSGLDLNSVGMNAQGKANGKQNGNAKKKKGKKTPGSGGLIVDPLGGTMGGNPSVDSLIGDDPLEPTNPLAGDPLGEGLTIDDPLGIDTPLTPPTVPTEPTVPVDPTTPNIPEPVVPDASEPTDNGAGDIASAFVDSINDANAASQTISQTYASNTEARRAMLTDYYNKMCLVSESIDKLGTSHRVVKNRLDEIRNLFDFNNEDNPRNKAFDHFAKDALNKSEPGAIALTGEVQVVGKVDGAPMLRLLVGEFDVLVLCPNDHDGSYKKGSQLFALGKLLSADEHDHDEKHVIKAHVLAIGKKVEQE